MNNKRLILGPRAVAEALRARNSSVDMLFHDGGSFREILDLAKKRGLRPELRTKEDLTLLAGGDRHQGVVAVAGEYIYADLEDLLTSSHSPLLVALDQVTDPHNFGAIVRTAVALGVDGVITLKDRAAPVTPAVVRASTGATEHAKIARVTNLARTLAQLQERGLSIVGLAGEGDTTLGEMPPAPGGRVLVVGSEEKGLRRLVRERCDVLVRIPMGGPIASLNASVAAAIAIYEARRLTHDQT